MAHHRIHSYSQTVYLKHVKPSGLYLHVSSTHASKYQVCLNQSTMLICSILIKIIYFTLNFLNMYLVKHTLA